MERKREALPDSALLSTDILACEFTLGTGDDFAAVKHKHTVNGHVAGCGIERAFTGCVLSLLVGHESKEKVSDVSADSERAWSRDHTTSSVTAVLPSLGQCCGTVFLNSIGNQTSPSDNSSNR